MSFYFKVLGSFLTITRRISWIAIRLDMNGPEILAYNVFYYIISRLLVHACIGSFSFCFSVATGQKMNSSLKGNRWTNSPLRPCRWEWCISNIRCWQNKVKSSLWKSLAAPPSPCWTPHDEIRLSVCLWVWGLSSLSSLASQLCFCVPSGVL